MRYEDERSVHVYVRKTQLWHQLGWEGRMVLWHLYTEADLFGRLEVPEGDEWRDVAMKLAIPDEVLRVGLDRLFTEDLVRWESPDGETTKRREARQGVVNCEGGALLIVEFEAMQRAKRSRLLRDFEYRERRRLAKIATERRLERQRVAKLKPAPQKVSGREVVEMGLVNRVTAAHLLGVSLATLRRREGSPLKTFLSEAGEHMFRPEEVKALRAKEDAANMPAPTAPREDPVEPSGHPIWRQRAARLAEKVGDGFYTTAEMHAIARRCGLKEAVVEETLAAAEGVELVKDPETKKWSAVVPAQKVAK